jgi:hypothetical protein
VEEESSLWGSLDDMGRKTFTGVWREIKAGKMLEAD